MLRVVIIEVPKTSIQVGGGHALGKLLVEFHTFNEIGRYVRHADDDPPREVGTLSGNGLTVCPV